MDPERDPFVEAQKSWDLGKQLGLYSDNEEEIIAALAKCGIAKGIDLKQGKLKKGREMKRTRRKKGCSCLMCYLKVFLFSELDCVIQVVGGRFPVFWWWGVFCSLGLCSLVVSGVLSSFCTLRRCVFCEFFGCFVGSIVQVACFWLLSFGKC